MAKYKPGQLVTFGRYIYRIRKGFSCAACIICRLTKNIEYPQFCIQSQKNPTKYGDPVQVKHNTNMCNKLLGENLFPEYVKINPLCVKN